MLLIVIPTRDDVKLISFNLIYKPVFLIDAPRPQTLELML
jgi:hypothetical protein